MLHYSPVLPEQKCNNCRFKCFWVARRCCSWFHSLSHRLASLWIQALLCCAEWGLSGFHQPRDSRPQRMTMVIGKEFCWNW